MTTMTYVYTQFKCKKKVASFNFKAKLKGSTN